MPKLLLCVLALVAAVSAATETTTRRVNRASAGATATATATAWPANCNAAMPSAAEWLELTNSRGRATFPQTTNMDAILRNSNPRLKPYIMALVAAWEVDQWDQRHANDATKRMDHGAFAKMATCVNQYFTHTVHPAFVANPATFLTNNIPSISGAVTLPGVIGAGQAQQLNNGNNPGVGAHYTNCDYTKVMNGLNGNCRAPAANGDLPLVDFAAGAGSLAQVWLKTTDRGSAWSLHGLTAQQANTLVIRVVPAAGFATSGLGGVPATFLPWKENYCTYTIIDANSRAAFTSGLSGCNVYVALDNSGAGRPPLWIHCNAKNIGDTVKQQAMNTGAAEIVRMNNGYVKHKKLTRPMYNPPQFSVSPYGTRANNGVWTWKAAVISHQAPYRRKLVNFANWQ